jgi:hypothetical protein
MKGGGFKVQAGVLRVNLSPKGAAAYGEIKKSNEHKWWVKGLV